MRTRRLVPLLLLLLLALPMAAPGADTTEEETSGTLGGSGLPLPRFVSLRASEVNLRTGPGTRYPIDWVYRREGLPVEIIDEFETWRRIRDREGTTGWVHQSMLSSRRTAVVVGERRGLLLEPNEAAVVLAWLEPGVLLRLVRCEGSWCEAEARDSDGGAYDGWLRRAEIWGVYSDERLQ